MINKIKRLILRFKVYRWNLWFGDDEFQMDCDTYEKLMKEYKAKKKGNTLKIELENGSTIETIETDEPIIRSNRGEDQLDAIAFEKAWQSKPVKFCPYCGSQNIALLGAYYKKHKCYECGSVFL